MVCYASTGHLFKLKNMMDGSLEGEITLQWLPAQALAGTWG